MYQLNPHTLRAFDEDLERHGLRLVSRQTVLYNVRRYLFNLQERDLLTAGLFNVLFPNYHPEYNRKTAAPLPDLATQFITVMSAIHKPNTVNGYRATLRAFYKIHWKREKLPYKITRSDVEVFMVNMKDRNIAANQRGTCLLQIRRYLDWLYEHKKLSHHPDELVRGDDLPKSEKRLPRPFPIDVDIELQKRFAESNEIAFQGLLLLRRCGLRVGELRSLAVDCVQQDLNGNSFLKVPIGKLNNERIIPLDPETLRVVEKVRCLQAKQWTYPGESRFLIADYKGRKRSRHFYALGLQEATHGLLIPGPVTLHRLRHSFATSLLSAGLSITSLKELMGHKDIRMTLGYAAVTQETIRKEYFSALPKIHERYEITAFTKNTPDLRNGVNQSFYETRRLVKKLVQDQPELDSLKLQRLMFRLNHLRHEISNYLKL